MAGTPAPIDPVALQAALRPWGRSVGLPGEAYTSEEVFDWERRQFFDDSWTCIGRAGVHRRHPSQRELGGWAFVNRSGHAEVPFEEQFGNLAAHLAPYEPERLVVGARHTYEIAANWKLLHENYQECLHCSEIHPELCRVTPPESGYSIDLQGLFIAGPMDLRDDAETMSLDGKSQGIFLRGLNERQRREVGYFGIFPNLLVSPHPDYVLTHRIEMIAPGRSFVECEWLFPPEMVERDDFDPGWAVEFWDVTNREDWEACESLQRGVASRGYRPGPLSTDWEMGPYMWVTMIARGYRDGHVLEGSPNPVWREAPAEAG
ncbi:MAG: RHO alpha subunit C-terminal catalytic domain-containing protein [Actinomycetota bacterium]